MASNRQNLPSSEAWGPLGLACISALTVPGVSHPGP